jgi:hypothetical protein
LTCWPINRYLHVCVCVCVFERQKERQKIPQNLPWPNCSNKHLYIS